MYFLSFPFSIYACKLASSFFSSFLVKLPSKPSTKYVTIWSDVIYFASLNFAKISELKKQVLACIMLTLIIFDLAFVDDDYLRVRRARRSRKQETEIVI